MQEVVYTLLNQPQDDPVPQTENLIVYTHVEANGQSANFKPCQTELALELLYVRQRTQDPAAEHHTVDLLDPTVDGRFDGYDRVQGGWSTDGVS